MEVQLPCGQCIGCRLERSRQWAVRCVHEASLYEENSFITFTYDEEHIPHDGSLNRKHLQDFWKRLRRRLAYKAYNPETGRRRVVYPLIRYFACGEYGDRYSRPHYHACVFNYRPGDGEIHTVRDGIPLYRSDFLDDVWGHGYTSFGDVTFESAAYVARYAVKKLNGDQASDAYSYFNVANGEVYELEPEYGAMSLRPGIGYDWIKTYEKQTYDWDSVVVRGVEQLPPRYYDDVHTVTAARSMADVKSARLRRAERRRHDSSTERLCAREQVKLAQVHQLRRGIEK